MSAPVTVSDLDQRIWEEELNEFVPQKIFDVHTHIYRWAFNLNPQKDESGLKDLLGKEWAESDWKLCDAVDAALMPGRTVHRLAFPFPFPYPCDFQASNDYIAEQTACDPKSGALMLVHPGMPAAEAESEVDRLGVLGFKPYRFYSATGDAVNCRITDFLPEPLIEVAHRKKLIIMMHISKRDAIADPENLADLQRLSDQYPDAKWVLAHCARSYSTWAIEKAASVLRKLPNMWYDVSSVCETDAMDALFNSVPVDRVMYGSDDIPIGVLRGKYITFGKAWAYLSPTNHSMNLSHCESRMTFTRYEQLRAMLRAAKRLGMTTSQREALFHDIAAKLVSATQAERTSKVSR